MKIFSFFMALISSCVFAETVYPTIVIGGGIGALTSSLYLSRAGTKPLIIEGATQGGLLTQSHSVQNWPGELEIPGYVLTEKMRSQVAANGGEFYSGEVIAVDFSIKPFKITTKSTDGEGKIRTFLTESCVIAMGTQPNYLGVPGESGPNGYWGRGVTNCAVCDGNLYKGAKVGVVGGGDAAVLEALYLSNIAKEVTVFVRKDKLRAQEKKRIEQMLSKGNIKVLYNTHVTQILGDKHGVTGVAIETDGKKEMFALDGLFLAIGSTPNSQIFKGKLALDANGYIVTDKTMKSSVNGVYAVGDIVDPVYKQAITASGDGAKAALEVQQYVGDLAAQNPKKEPFSSEAVRGEVIEIRAVEQFERELAEAKVPVIVDFYAPWCGPCKRISPIFEAIAGKHSGKARFLKVNVDKFHKISEKYNIRSLPTVITFERGAISDQKVGLQPIQEHLAELR